MFPFLNNFYWWLPQVVPAAGTAALQRVDVGGIYELRTNAVQVTDASVDYGVNPCAYNALPCESIVLLKIAASTTDTSTGTAATLPVTVVVPNSGTSTVSTNGSSTGTTKVAVTDSQGNSVTGSDVTGNTERLAYINKRTGVIRFLEFTSGTAATTPSAVRAVKEK